jgi:hypothetical protein
MADAIDHDAASTTATVATKAVKWGVIGAIAAFAIPAVVVGGAGLLLGAGISAMATGGIGGAIASISGFLVGALGVAGGIAAGTASAASFGGAAAAGGALVGVAKGGAQVSAENAAFRRRENGVQFTEAKKANEREIRGFQQGYAVATADMEPKIQQREKNAFDNGQKYVVDQIHDHMNAQMQAQAGAVKTASVGFGEKELSLKCESKAEAVLKQRELDAMAQKQV